MSKTERLGQAKQAQFQNLREDNLKIRAATFKNHKAYDRTAAKRDWKKDA